MPTGEAQKTLARLLVDTRSTTRTTRRDESPATVAVRSVSLGLGATATMDAGAEVVRRTTGVEPLVYRLLARWIGHMGRGRFTHAIADADPVR